MKPVAKSMPANAIASTKKIAPILVASTVTVLVTRLSSFCSGLGSSPTLWVRWAIFPNSVSIAAAKTTAVPVQATHGFPLRPYSAARRVTIGV